jgi:hypothetical protein
MEKLVLTVHNRHRGASGPAPNLETKDHWYTAYFENGLGEQLVFQYDRIKKEGWLWHGDITWREPLKVKDGCCPTLILDVHERQWLSLVWQVARGVS